MENMLLFANDKKQRKHTKIKRANDLDGKTWTSYSISVWSDISKSAEEKNLNHPAMFPLQLADRCIRIFTKNNERNILDPFMGSGSTIIAAHKLGKKGIGFDIEKKYIALAKSRLEQEEFNFSKIKRGEIELYNKDANLILDVIKPNSIDFCLTSPPYWDILTQKRTADGKDVRNYGNNIKDLGRICDYYDFLDALKNVFQKVYMVLKKNKYCVAVIMDIRKGNVFYPFHIDFTKLMTNIGFIFDDMIIWDRKKEYNNLRPLGYPAVFRVNKIHEYILIFQKI